MNGAGQRATAAPEPGRPLRLLRVGVAPGRIRLARADFEANTGFALREDYGTVGATSAKLRGGAAADVAILSRAAVDELGREGLLLVDTAADLGRVAASIAAKSGRRPLALDNEDDLRAALLDAPALFVPDVHTSTAGRHFLRVLATLDIADAVTGKLVVGADAAATIRGLVDCSLPDALGCAQSTEILGTPGLRLAAALPGRLALDTVYAAAVVATSEAKDRARALVEHLTGPAGWEWRSVAGFSRADRAPAVDP